MARQLLLHIGHHKTGTTAIQAYLHKHRELLNIHNWDLYNYKPDGNLSKSGNGNSWIRFSGQKSEFKAAVNPLLYEKLAQTSKNIIFSSEELAWINDAESIKRIYTELSKIFSVIIVVCYLRRQDKHLLSHFQQGFKYPHSSARSFYGKHICVIPEHQPHFATYLNYFEKLSNWENCVGFNNMIVKEFERSRLYRGDSICDFIQLLPFKVSSPKPKKAVTNESINILQCIINGSVFEARYSLWYQLGQQSFTEHKLFYYRKKPALSAQKSISVLENYIESNKKLLRYLPDLPENWYELSGEDLEPESPENNITAEDYHKALTAVIRYYDNLSLKSFIKIKLRRFFNKNYRTF